MNTAEFNYRDAHLTQDGADNVPATPGNSTVAEAPGGSSDPSLRVFVHDMRNLLAPIRNAAHLLRLRGAADASLLPIAEMIDRQATGIGRMLDGVGQPARIKHASAAEDAPKSNAEVQAKPAMREGKRILLADDNHSLRISLVNILEEMGYQVKAAGDGEEAIALAREWVPAFVLLDIHMPKFDGLEVARQLRSQFSPDIMKLVMMSGDTLSDLTVRAAKLAGFDHCVDKVDAVGLLQQLFEKNG